MADGKWISDLTAATPLADAARRVLTVRLAAVHAYLPLAMRQSAEDPEHVHQLRVSTRRAGAALEIFSACLPEKDYRLARKTLRRIRRAAGAARDWDVFLGETPPIDKANGRQPVRDLIVGYAVGRRLAAQADLEVASPNFPFDYERFQAETIAAVRKPKDDPALRSLLDLAQPMLTRLLHELHAAASGDLNDYDHLHQVRIVGKRVRYAMEVFVDCFSAAFKDELYPAVEKMQSILGDANDSHVAAGHLRELLQGVKVQRAADWRRWKSGLETMIRDHDERVKLKQAEFIRWWQDWQQSGGESAFTALLKPAPAAAAEPAEDAPDDDPPHRD